MLQLKVFMDEVQQHHLLGTIRSYLKLYTTLPLSKLATFMDMSIDELKTALMCFKVTSLLNAVIASALAKAVHNCFSFTVLYFNHRVMKNKPFCYHLLCLRIKSWRPLLC